MAEGFISDFKRFFLRGLAAVLPTLVTLMFLIWAVKSIHQYIGRYISLGVFWAIEFAWAKAKDMEAGATLPADQAAAWSVAAAVVGFVLAIVAVYIFGRFVASYLGRGFWHLIERMMLRTPVIKAIYPSVKQVTDFLFSERKVQFSRVVAERKEEAVAM